MADSSACLERSNGESIYPYISMGTITSMMLLFTRSSRIRSANVGNHAIVFKSLRFGPFTLKRNPRVFKLKRGLQRFSKVSVFDLENAAVVQTIRAKETKMHQCKRGLSHVSCLSLVLVM